MEDYQNGQNEWLDDGGMAASDAGNEHHQNKGLSHQKGHLKADDGDAAGASGGLMMSARHDLAIAHRWCCCANHYRLANGEQGGFKGQFVAFCPDVISIGCNNLPLHLSGFDIYRE